MFIIFGWGHRTSKGLGPVQEHTCGRCQRTEFWQLQKTTEWFTLFFIPVIPYSTKYLKFCPVCQNFVSVSKEEYERLVPLAELNMQAAQGQVSREEYEHRMRNMQ